jgi:hypothetical protein
MGVCVGVDGAYVENNEGGTVTCRECRDGFKDAIFGTGSFPGAEHLVRGYQE